MFDILVVVFETKRAQTQLLEYDSVLSFYTVVLIDLLTVCLGLFWRYSDTFVYCGLWL